MGWLQTWPRMSHSATSSADKATDLGAADAKIRGALVEEAPVRFNGQRVFAE